MSYLDDNLICLIEKTQQDLEYITNQLTFEEVLMDNKLTATLKKRQSVLLQIIDKYNQIKELTNQIDNLNDGEKEILKFEIENIKDQILKLKNVILHLIFDQNGQVESVSLTITAKQQTKYISVLLNSYKNFCKLNNMQLFEVEQDENSANVYICGQNAQKYFLGENGIHKFLNINIEVLCYPKIDNPLIDVEENDIKIDIFRSNGAGGQNVNKVSTAIRATHIPTNITVVCQDERSQLQNKNRAIEVLTKRVKEFYLKEYEKNINELKKKFYSKKLKRTYNYEHNLVTEENESYSLTRFLEGDYLEFLNK